MGRLGTAALPGQEYEKIGRIPWLSFTSSRRLSGTLDPPPGSAELQVQTADAESVSDGCS
jgi:hypothetical protein